MVACVFKRCGPGVEQFAFQRIALVDLENDLCRAVLGEQLPDEFRGNFLAVAPHDAVGIALAALARVGLRQVQLLRVLRVVRSERRVFRRGSLFRVGFIVDGFDDGLFVIDNRSVCFGLFRCGFGGLRCGFGGLRRGGFRFLRRGLRRLCRRLVGRCSRRSRSGRAGSVFLNKLIQFFLRVLQIDLAELHGKILALHLQLAERGVVFGDHVAFLDLLSYRHVDLFNDLRIGEVFLLETVRLDVAVAASALFPVVRGKIAD